MSTYDASLRQPESEMSGLSHNSLVYKVGKMTGATFGWFNTMKSNVNMATEDGLLGWGTQMNLPAFRADHTSPQPGATLGQLCGTGRTGRGSVNRISNGPAS